MGAHPRYSPGIVVRQLAQGKSLYRALSNVALARYTLGGRVLDIGAKDGNGSYWKYLKKGAGVEVVGSDLFAAPGVIALNVEQPFPIKTESFDCVLALNLFEHVGDHSRSAAEIFRILVPGGRFFILTPFLHEYHADPDDYLRFTDSYLKRWWESAGLQCESVEALSEGIFTWFACKLPPLFLPPIARPAGMVVSYLTTTLLDRIAALRPRVSGRSISERFPCGYLGVFKKSS